MSRIKGQHPARSAADTPRLSRISDPLVGLHHLDKPDNRMWVEKDNHFICWANSIDEAKAKIDEVVS